MTLNKYRFTIECEEKSQENKLARELIDKLQDISPNINLHQEKNSQDTLDLGSIIVAIIGTPFAIEAVRVIGAWLLKHPEGSISIDQSEQNGTKTTKIRAKGLTAEQLAKQLEIALK